MRRSRFFPCTCTSLLLAAGAMAARPALAEVLPVELTPYIGVRNGADLDANLPGGRATADPSLSFGFGVQWFVRPDGWFEGFLDHQTLHFTQDLETFGSSGFDFAIDYLQFGGGYEPPEGRVRPYVAAAVGLTRYGASTGEVEHTLGASGSLAGGLRVPIGTRVSFRFELRGYATIGDAAISVTCGPGCNVQYAGVGWYQFAARAGLSIRL